MISIKNLNFHYSKKENPVIEKLNTNLPSGRIYGLLGLNGAGKTSLLKLIAGISFPKSGHIEVFNKIPKNREIEFLGDLYFFEDEVSLPNWSLKKWVDLYASIYPNFDHKLFDEIMIQFNVEKDKYINDLSYGQKKKLNIAFGLATRARVLLMDEPTNGLDIPSKGQLRKVLAKSISEDSILIISTHQIRDIYPILDHILILKDHRLIVDQSIDNLSKIFRITNKPMPDEIILYTDETLTGKKNLVKNETGLDETILDIELFFNSIISNPEIESVLNNTNASFNETIQ